MAMSYYFYILQSTQKEIYYYGSSDDPDRRLGYHNSESDGFIHHTPYTNNMLVSSDKLKI